MTLLVTALQPTLAGGAAMMPPEDLSAAAVSSTAIDLTWVDTNVKEKRTIVERKVDGRRFKRIARAGRNVTSYRDTRLASGVRYSYRVRVHGPGWSPYSNVASAETWSVGAGGTPSAPLGVSAIDVSCSQVNVSWSASTDVGGAGLKGYNLYRNGAYVRQIMAPATSTADVGLTPSTGFTYAVSAVDYADNESARSAPAGASTSACGDGSSLNPTLIGFVPGVGAAEDVVLVGTTAYVASAEFGLAQVDVSVPGAARALAGAVPSFYGERLAVSGGTAVVTTTGVGLEVIDLTAPGGPATVAALPGTMKGVALAGRYAYVLQVIAGNPAHTDLIVVDVGVPSAPAVVGRLTVVSASELTLAGSFVYLAGGSAGLQVIDVTTPTAPRIAGNLATAGTVSGVAVAGPTAYVADGSAVRVVDVSTPGQPVERGSVSTSAVAIAVAGSRAYVVDGLQLKIIDVSNAAAPALLGASTGYGAQRVAAAGTTVYLASPDTNPALNQGGLYVVDASNPSAPHYLTNVYGGFDSWDVAVAGAVSVVTGNALGLRVVDLGVPTAPRPVGALAGTFQGASMGGAYAYAMQIVPGNPAETDLVMVDVHTPSVPVIVGRVAVAGGSEVTVSGTRAYVAAGAAGLQIIDVGNPAAPHLLGTVNTTGTAHAVAVGSAGYAYVADESAVLAVDVSNPAAPAVRGSVPTTATAIAVAGTRVYATDGLQLKIIDVSNPAAPLLLGASTGYGAQSVDAVGTTVVLATPAISHLDTSGGVFVLDASNPAAPRLVRQVTVPGTTHGVRAGGGACYAGDSAALIDVIRF